MKALNVPGTPLTVRGCDIYGKTGRIRKPGKRDCFTFYYLDGSRGYASRWKLVWCAEHATDPRKVSKAWSFRYVNGTVLRETFSHRMSLALTTHWRQSHVKWEEYDFIERYARACKELLSGDGGARSRIFILLNSRRDSLIHYAKSASGGVGKAKAIDFADEAILYTFELTIGGRYHVPSPMASMRGRLNLLIKRSRRHREYKEEL